MLDLSESIMSQPIEVTTHIILRDLLMSQQIAEDNMSGDFDRLGQDWFAEIEHSKLSGNDNLN